MTSKKSNQVLNDTDLFEHLAASESERHEAASFDIAAFFEKSKTVRESPASFEAALPPRPNLLHIELEGEVIGDRLVLTAPSDIPLPFTLQGNAIVLGDYYISVRWKGKVPSHV